jgi:hypothetical protein
LNAKASLLIYTDQVVVSYGEHSEGACKPTAHFFESSISPGNTIEKNSFILAKHDCQAEGVRGDHVREFTRGHAGFGEDNLECEFVP